ncbi:GTP-binding protein LepA [Propionibacteriaceae bacterium Y2011]|uniref:GTP-binding protein LepA n=1 Tax=Microlunatus sp. Y2014 TaxID=3418488 RepID=UPI003B45107A
MPRQFITGQKIREHVQRLGELYPPIPVDSVDFTVHDPTELTRRFGHVLDYLARVELEVDRNVLELLVLLPDVDETNRMFYADVWHPQEIQHGLILDRLQTDLGQPPAVPTNDVAARVKLLAPLAHIKPIQEIVRFLYFLTGASTERQAVLAYNRLTGGLNEMGETAIAETLIGPIKQQEPGHFAFYQMSATSMIQHEVLKPWQLYLARILRERSFGLVGTNHNNEYRKQYGGVVVALGLDEKLESYAREIGRLEARLLWAKEKGMEFPPYVLRSLRESVSMYRDEILGGGAQSATA